MTGPHPLRLGASLSARLHRSDGVVTLALAGDLDLAGVVPFTAALHDLEAAGPRALLLDLRELDFLDSSGMKAVYDTHVRAEGLFVFGVLAGRGSRRGRWRSRASTRLSRSSRRPTNSRVRNGAGEVVRRLAHGDDANRRGPVLHAPCGRLDLADPGYR